MRVMHTKIIIVSAGKCHKS